MKWSPNCTSAFGVRRSAFGVAFSRKRKPRASKKKRSSPVTAFLAVIFGPFPLRAGAPERFTLSSSLRSAAGGKCLTEDVGGGKMAPHQQAEIGFRESQPMAVSSLH